MIFFYYVSVVWVSISWPSLINIVSIIVNSYKLDHTLFPFLLLKSYILKFSEIFVKIDFLLLFIVLNFNVYG